ncbi:hydroxymethylbilane synthase [Bartonella sp. TP]|uniref:hydroxymethylbilane synthase n=1 Tax=Bartonella sp. TP TaxID=3057550 RepID=UPI0025B0F6AB|nr:hydroxymethylbilane synthase [Bartonella sp. TP]MDN5248534.1 hydroxymethylbilane synthase [Alphaproteobacteria bacterium]WJW79543.1 hydroxymethylbilane synthase [Bartonella sp. TP]
MQRKIIKIGSRSSNLALAMSLEVKLAFQAAHGLSSNDILIESMSTQGDRILNRSLAQIGGKGLFTAEIEDALLANRIDVAVHSTKDMPTLLPDNLIIAAYMKRAAVADCFISHNKVLFEDLPPGATIGTSALRRQALVKKLRPDLNIVLLRGNVETRLAKVQTGQISGTFLALSGLQRLGLTEHITQIMDVATFPPAPGQGAICLETRQVDLVTQNLLSKLDHFETHIALSAERAFLKQLDGSCRTPICAYAFIENNKLYFHGMILSVDGKESFEIKEEFALKQMLMLADACEIANNIGIKGAQQLLEYAGADFFADWE